MEVTRVPRQMFGGAAKKAVKVYQDYISAEYNGEKGAHCMYTPSCSAYMKEAVDQEGIVQGTLTGMMRLKRCSTQELARTLEGFVMQLATTPKDQIAARFETEDQAVLDKLEVVQGYLGKMQMSLMQGKQDEAKAINDQWVHMLRDELRVLKVEHPDTDPNAPPRFKIIHNRPWVAPERPELSLPAQALTSSAGVVGGLLGGAAGLAAFGVAGMAYGAYRATNAGLGQNGDLEASWTRKYGSSAAQGSVLDQKLAGWHEKLSARVGDVAASVVLGPLGFVAGLAAGLFAGGKLGASEGWQMGSILGRNLTRELVDGRGETHRHPAGCGCGCRVEGHKVDTPMLASTPVAAARPWTLIGHLDATSSDLEAMRTRQVIDFERAPHQDAHVVLQLRREGKDVESLKRSAAFKKFGVPALAAGVGAAATCLFGLSGLPAILLGA